MARQQKKVTKKTGVTTPAFFPLSWIINVLCKYSTIIFIKYQDFSEYYT